jgi:hypothetical protein
MAEKQEISLKCLDNYKAKARWDICLVTAKFIEIVNDYLERALDGLNVESEEYLEYLVLKGERIILHVFIFILLYTNNDTLALIHAQKGSYLYIEFMGQIGQADNAYLGLSAKDASMFVYKKTIFDIDSHIRKNWVDPDLKTKTRFDSVELMANLYVSVTKRLIEHREEKKLQDRLTLLSKKTSNYQLIELMFEMKKQTSNEQFLARLSLLKKATEFYIDTTKTNAEMLNALKCIAKKISRGVVAPKDKKHDLLVTEHTIKIALENGDIVKALQMMLI